MLDCLATAPVNFGERLTPTVSRASMAATPQSPRLLAVRTLAPPQTAGKLDEQADSSHLSVDQGNPQIAFCRVTATLSVFSSSLKAMSFGLGTLSRNFSRWPSRLNLQTRLVRSWRRSEEHTSELQSLMRISYAVFCLKKKNTKNNNINRNKQLVYT